MNQLVKEQWRGIAAATIITFVLGFTWFHPAVFGTIWATAAGVELGSPPIFAVGMTLLANFLASLGIAFVMLSSRRMQPLQGLWLGVLATLFFVLPAIIGQWIFMDKIRLFAVNIGYNLVALTATGLVVGALRRKSGAVDHGNNVGETSHAKA